MGRVVVGGFKKTGRKKKNGENKEQTLLGGQKTGVLRLVEDDRKRKIGQATHRRIRRRFAEGENKDACSRSSDKGRSSSTKKRKLGWTYREWTKTACTDRAKEEWVPHAANPKRQRSLWREKKG